MFPANNYWHARVDALPVHPSSRQWLSNMDPTTRLHPDFGPSFGEQDVPYGIPITVVQGEDRVPVAFEYGERERPCALPAHELDADRGRPRCRR